MKISLFGYACEVSSSRALGLVLRTEEEQRWGELVPFEVFNEF